jgi:hypothetical protein
MVKRERKYNPPLKPALAKERHRFMRTTTLWVEEILNVIMTFL